MDQQPERVRYFDQQFLRVDDFNAEQNYHRDMRRRHNRMLHTPGIADGLLLVPDGTGVKVTPGAAIPGGGDENGGGAEIVLAEEHRQELSSFDANVAVFVTIAFAQEAARERNDAGIVGETRWREKPKIEVFESDPTATLPTDETQPLRVLLGKVQRGGSNGMDVIAIDGSDRRLAGAAESELSLTPRDPAVLEPDWVRLRWIGRGQSEFRGDLQIIKSKSSDGELVVAGRADLGGDLIVRAKADVRGELVVGGTATVTGQLAVTGRALVMMGHPQGTVVGDENGKVTGGLGFLGWSIQHGQLSFRAGHGFEFVDRSHDIPSLDYAQGSKPYADLRVRNLHAIGGAIHPSAGSSDAGIQFPKNIGGGGDDEAFIRYYVQSGEDTALVIGVANDPDDRIELHQAKQPRLTVHDGKVGIGTRTPAHRLDVAGDIGLNGKVALREKDAWLQLNSGLAFTGGVYTPGNLSVDGNVTFNGTLTAGDVRIEGLLHTVGNVTSGGRLGIGTTTPLQRLDVAGGIGINGKVAMEEANTLLHLNSDLAFRGGVYTPGNVGVGGNVTISGNLGTHGRSHEPARAGWGGGIRTHDVEAEGTIWSLAGYDSGPRDLAENFACDVELEPGDVVVLDRARDIVVRCREANDSMVVGVVSTAPGMLLGAGRADPPDLIVAPIALAGRVPCKVTTANGHIARGDLLTASPELGRAMRAAPLDLLAGEPIYRPGTIVGKALESCDEATGTIEIMVLAR